MAKGKKTGKGWKVRYQSYSTKDSGRLNKIRDLKRHLKKFPHDEVAKAGLKKAEGHEYSHRSKPIRKKGRMNDFLPRIPKGAKGAGKVDYKRIGKIRVSFKDGQEPTNDVMFIHYHESLNRLSGRISKEGMVIQQGVKFMKGVANICATDKDKKCFPKNPEWWNDSDMQFVDKETESTFKQTFNVKPKRKQRPKKRKAG